MKPKWLKDVKDLLDSPDFKSWWAQLETARRDLRVTQEQEDEVLTQNNLLNFRAEMGQRAASDLLFKAGEYEDAATHLLADASDLDNRSFRIVAEFEDMRVLVSDLWYKLGSAEENVRELTEEIARLKDRLTKANASERGSLETELRKRDADLKTQNKDLRRISEEYEREAARKSRMWTEVERIWNKSLTINLSVTERRRKGAKIRLMAERLFQQVESNHERAEKLETERESLAEKIADAHRRVTALLEQATEKFECVAGEDFLYWPQREDANRVYCLSLVTDAEAYRVPVMPLKVYGAQRQSGVDSLDEID